MAKTHTLIIPYCFKPNEYPIEARTRVCNFLYVYGCGLLNMCLTMDFHGSLVDILRKAVSFKSVSALQQIHGCYHAHCAREIQSKNINSEEKVVGNWTSTP